MVANKDWEPHYLRVVGAEEAPAKGKSSHYVSATDTSKANITALKAAATTIWTANKVEIQAMLAAIIDDKAKYSLKPWTPITPNAQDAQA